MNEIDHLKVDTWLSFMVRGNDRSIHSLSSQGLISKAIEDINKIEKVMARNLFEGNGTSENQWWKVRQIDLDPFNKSKNIL